MAFAQGDYASARTLYEESLALHREAGLTSEIAYCLNNLGNVAQEVEDNTHACALYLEGLMLCLKLGDNHGIATILAGTGGAMVGVGQVERGARLFGAIEALLQARSGRTITSSSLTEKVSPMAQATW